MAEYKNHHYVPQHILNNFKNENNNFFYYNKKTPHKPVEHRNTEKVFSENYLYSYETKDGGISSEVEFNYFKQLDTKVAPVIQLIIESVRSDKQPNLSPDQKTTWDEFFIKQEARSPESLHGAEVKESLEETYGKTKAKVYERLSPELKKLIDNDAFKNRLQMETKVKALETQFSESIKVLAKRGLYFAKITNPKKSFIIGSKPLVRINNGGSNHLDDPNTELWYPIAYDVAVSIGSHKEHEKLFFLDSKKTKLIRQINLEIKNKSDEFAGKSLQLISSLKKSKTSA